VTQYDIPVPMSLDRHGPVSLREQILTQLRSAIADGVLDSHDPLPSSRALAAGLGVARGTVLACYLELEGDGWIYSTHGAGTFVADRRRRAERPPEPNEPPVPSPAPTRSSLMPGELDPTVVPMTAWRAAWRAAAAPSATPAPPAGAPELRAALAGYLSSARGLPCHADEIVVCAGTSEAIVLLGLAFGWHGRDIGVEDPGYPAVRQVLYRLGARVTPLDVTGPDSLLHSLRARPRPPAAVYLTPSNQHPLGHRIETAARYRLLAWAAETGTALIEDDYDGEFRFGVAPLASLAGLAPDGNAIYLGTMSKILDPGLRLAYLRVPPRMRETVLAARADLGSTVGTPTQAAVTHLLRSGELSRHIARVRRLYADRRRALLRSLGEVPAVGRVRGMDAGLHVVAELHPDLSSAAVVAQALDRGVALCDMDDFRATPDPSAPALVLGYGALSPNALRRAVATLAACPELRRIAAPGGEPGPV
jgi:GntR family transcriptional regulator/MocR family aminotransferase